MAAEIREFLDEELNIFSAATPSNPDWNHLYVDRLELPSPVLLRAGVVHGFKRGSKTLGIPTANLSMEDVGEVGSELKCGVYFGWCSLLGAVHQAVVSVGWNPHFDNKLKTIEVHLLSELNDFYGCTIIVALCGYLRNEFKFDSLGW